VASQYLGDEMVAEGMKEANVMVGCLVHVFLHVYTCIYTFLDYSTRHYNT
jgi:hypothetical protein